MEKHTKPMVSELAPEEVQRLVADKVFARFRPVNCAKCNHTGGFFRRIFHVKGVPKSKQSDDATQDILRHHFYHKHELTAIQFRTHDHRFYVDSATCPKCKSTTIVYDITLDDDVMAAMAERFGGDPKKMKAEIEAIANALRKKGACR